MVEKGRLWLYRTPPQSRPNVPLAILFHIILMTGCAGLAQDHTADLDPQELERREGSKNVAAIKEMMAAWPTPPSSAVSPSPAFDSPGDRDTPLVTPKAQEIERNIDARPLLTVPQWETVPSQPFQIRPLLSKPPNYTTESRLLIPPVIAPYTFFAPTGSAYPGSIRCVPDYLGGSRCSVSP